MNEISTREKKELDKIADGAIQQLENNAREINRLALVASSAAASVTSRSDALANQKFLKRLWNNVTGKNRKLQNQINYDNSKALYLSKDILVKLSEQQNLTLGVIRGVNLRMNNAVESIGREIIDIYNEIGQLYDYLADMKEDIRLLQWVNAVEVSEDFQNMSVSESLFKIASDFYKIKGGSYENIDLLQMKKAVKSAGLSDKTITYREFVEDMQYAADSFVINQYTDRLMTPVSLGISGGADSVYGETMIDVDAETDAFDFAAMLLVELDELKESAGLEKKARALPEMVKAAANGDAKAQYYIGRIYIEGEITERNAEKGLKCIIAAAKNGSAEAKNYLEAVKNG